MSVSLVQSIFTSLPVIEQPIKQTCYLYQRKDFSKFCGYRRSTSGSEEPLEIMIGFMLFFLLSPSWNGMLLCLSKLESRLPKNS